MNGCLRMLLVFVVWDVEAVDSDMLRCKVLHCPWLGCVMIRDHRILSQTAEFAHFHASAEFCGIHYWP